MNYTEAPDTGVISKREIIGILFLRKHLLFWVVIGCIATASFLVLYFFSPTYESKAKIIINVSQLLIPLADAPPLSDFEKLTIFHTQKDIIKSTAIIGKVVGKLDLGTTRVIGNYEKLKLTIKDIRRYIGRQLNIKNWKKPADPVADSISAVTDHLSTQTSPESNVLTLEYAAKSPTEAAETLNAIIEVYQSYYQGLLTKRASGIATYMQEKLDQVSGKLNTAELDLLAFKLADKFQLTYPNDGEKNYLNGTSSHQARDVVVGLSDSKTAQNQLKIYIMSLQEKLRQMEEKYTSNNPEIAPLRKKVDMYLKILGDMPKKELEFLRKKRQLELSQDIYLFVSKNLEKAKSVQMGNLKTLNIITILEDAVVNETAVFPKPKLTIAFAIIMGFLLAIVIVLVQHYLDHTIRNTRDVELYLGLKTLGSLREIT